MPTTNVMLPFDRLRELEKKRFLNERKGQVPIMDAATLRELCLENDGYETPELNDSMYAHFRGFQRIEGLEQYYNLKALWLESNGLSKIENLEGLNSLRCLYLSKNLIEKIENLDSLRKLNTLDVSENRIQTLKGLAQLPNLLSLNASRNCLTTSADLEELALCPLLNNIDISHNLIEDSEILSVLKTVPNLKALRITGNRVVSSTRSFRKTYIAALPQLSFLDRPIFPIERTSVTAWQSGGDVAEREAKRLFVNQENEERRSSLREFRDWQAQVREDRIKELVMEREQKMLKVGLESKLEDCDVELRKSHVISINEFAAKEHAKGVANIEEYPTDFQQVTNKVRKTSKKSMFWSASALPQLIKTNAVTLGPQTSLQSENEEGVERCPNGDHMQKDSEAMLQTARLDAPGSNCPIIDGEDVAAVGFEITASPVSIVQAVQNVSAIQKSEDPVTHTVSEMTRVCEAEAVNTAERMEKNTAEQFCSKRNEQGDRHIAHTSVSLSGDAKPILPPPPPKSVHRAIKRGPADVKPRETWAQLQQRAGAAPCQLRPYPLPSAFGQDEDSEHHVLDHVVGNEGDDTSHVRALSRADILLELGLKQEEDGHDHLHQGVTLLPPCTELD